MAYDIIDRTIGRIATMLVRVTAGFRVPRGDDGGTLYVQRVAPAVRICAYYNATTDVVTDYVDSGAVQAGVMWRITHVTFFNLSHAGTYWSVGQVVEGEPIPIRRVFDQVANQPRDWDGEVFLQEGESIRFVSSGATVGDSLRLCIFGESLAV